MCRIELCSFDRHALCTWKFSICFNHMFAIRALPLARPRVSWPTYGRALTIHPTALWLATTTQWFAQLVALRQCRGGGGR